MAKKFVNADDPRAKKCANQEGSVEQLDSNISDDFVPQNSYHLRLIAPQIQLQSEKNPKAVVLVTAKGMELKVIEVMDKERMFDEVSGLVQRRFSVAMDSTQFFVTHQKLFSSQLLSLYSGSYYGVPAGSTWPPWVPMEVMFDFHVDPFGFKRVVHRTSATLRYDKYNTLRLKYNDEIGNGADQASPSNLESRMDHLSVEFPQVRAICDSAQYYAMYIIVLDLLMYSEPLEKTRTERLEKIMLASDFSDLRGAPEMVTRLQERIRQLDEIKTQFQINSKYLDKRGWEDRLLLDRDLATYEEELFFMMKAITSSQRKYEGTESTGLLRWNISSNQIVWHLTKDNNNDPLMEFQLQRAEYNRTDNSDGSHNNLMQIGKIVGLNLLPDAIYPEMFAPYSDADRGAFDDQENQHMLKVYWYMLEAIAGIPVMDHFEVNLFPMKIQLEREVGKRLFDYIFPGQKDDPKNKSPFMVKNMEPVQDEDEDEDENTSFTPGSSNLTVGGQGAHDSGSSTRAGSLELRLRPTMTSEVRPGTAVSHKTKSSSLYSNQGSDNHYFRLFQSSSKNPASSRNGKSLSKKPSVESLRSISSRPTFGRTPTGVSSHDSSSITSEAKAKRFGLHRRKKEKPSDDLTQMISRASNYMTLAHVKIPSVVLCLSYKGRGERNIEDVHDFVFRLPEIEYLNKTWSNLDLAQAIKKDVIRALISHTGAIIGNKFSKHRPTVTQQSRLRELATSSVLLTPSSQETLQDSDASSAFGTSPRDDAALSVRSKSPIRSLASSGDGYNRPSSASSSIASFHSLSNIRSQTIPSSLAMTPAQHRPQTAGEIGTKSIKSGLEGPQNFVASTLSKLKKRGSEKGEAVNMHNDHGNGLGDDAGGDETITSKRSKAIKKILGGLN